jgi:aryl-alcohol dehydrogenase-like predicted oxidoreductase
MSASSPAATPEGTLRYKKRFENVLDKGHFRLTQGLWMSSIGLGSYLGDPNERVDQGYRDAVKRAVALGCNVFDTAANYRFQRSERNFGDAFADLFADGEVLRDELVVSTKGGYLPFDSQPPRSRQEMAAYLEETFIKPGVCRPEDFVDGSHCMTPEYLAHQLEQSLRNLRLDRIDIFYIHNPESQLSGVSRAEFDRRLRAAFEFLESAVEQGKINMYGTATWNGYRVKPTDPDYLSLQQVAQAARDIAGDGSHFKIIQLPFNLAMPEAITHANQIGRDGGATLLEVAAEHGLTVAASGSLLQSRLTRGLPAIVLDAFPGLETDAQRALQFTRSAPGVDVALVGMSGVSHVEENLALAKISPASQQAFQSLFSANP